MQNRCQEKSKQKALNQKLNCAGATKSNMEKFHNQQFIMVFLPIEPLVIITFSFSTLQLSAAHCLFPLTVKRLTGK